MPEGGGELFQGLGDAVGGLAEGDTGLEVEGERDGGELAGVIDGDGAGALPDFDQLA